MCKDKADALKQERIKGLERMVLNFYLRFKNCQLIMTRKKDLLIFSWDCILPKYRLAMDFCLYTSYTTIRYKVQIVSFGYKFQPICLKFCVQAWFVNPLWIVNYGVSWNPWPLISMNSVKTMFQCFYTIVKKSCCHK